MKHSLRVILTRAWTLDSYLKQQCDIDLSISLSATQPQILKSTRFFQLYTYAYADFSTSFNAKSSYILTKVHDFVKIGLKQSECHLCIMQLLFQELFCCHGIRKLCLSNNEVTNIPPAIGSLINLEELDVSKNGNVSVLHYLLDSCYPADTRQCAHFVEIDLT